MLAGMTQEQTNEYNREHCKRIAEEIEKLVDGHYYRCPECGEIINLDDTEYNEDTNTYPCPECKKDMADENLEPYSLYEYFDDVYDIEYRIDGNRNFRSVQVMVACGGPNIYVDTGSGYVELYWGMDNAKYALSYDAIDAINDVFEERYSWY